MNIQRLTIRQMQIYAALCLKKFCRNFGIRHGAIDELTEHLTNIGCARDLLDWDRRGRQLTITGRGDELPLSVVSAVPGKLLADFGTLIDFSVEVGIIDMYGDPSDAPAQFLQNCLDILAKYSIAAPFENGLSSLGESRVDVWGTPVDEAELSNFLRHLDLEA